MMIERACLECGLVEAPAEERSCAACRLELLSLDDPAHDQALDESTELRFDLARSKYTLVLLVMISFAVVLATQAVGGRDAPTHVLPYPLVAFGALVNGWAVRRRMAPGWRSLLRRRKHRPEQRRRRLRSWIFGLLLATLMAAVMRYDPLPLS